jgi:hypothetical protein
MSKQSRIHKLTKFIVAIVVLAGCLPCWSGNKKAPANVVDSGTFDIMIGGKKVATEVFEISQQTDFSQAKGTLKTEDGSKESQSYDLEMLPSGNLRHYEWSESGASKGQSTVEPQNDFLVQHITSTTLPKPVEQPYVLPPSTAVLDDYFFSQRELLLWRYLGTNCAKPTEKGCPMPKTNFGVIVPRQRNSMSVSIEFKGREKILLRGREVELSRFQMHTETDDWSLWMDDQYKLQRVLVDSDQTEVIRE